MNDHLHRLLNLAPGIIRDQSGLISQRIETSDGLRLLKMQHVSPPEVGKWVQVRKGIYKGDLGYATSTKGGEVQLLLIPRLSQPRTSRGNPSHSCFAPTLFDYGAVKQLYSIEPVRIQDKIYLFRGDRFEHGLVIKSYASDLVSTTVSCMPLESLWRFVESCHPKLMASTTSFLKPFEWHFAEGDEVYILEESNKSGVISTLQSDSVELTTEEGIVRVPWLKISKAGIRQGDFVEVTGGMHLGQTGWVGELREETRWFGRENDDGGRPVVQRVANIVRIEEKEKPLSDRTQVFPIPFEYSTLVLIFPSDI